MALITYKQHIIFCKIMPYRHIYLTITAVLYLLSASGQTVYLDQGYQRTRAEMATYTLPLSPDQGQGWIGVLVDENNNPRMTGSYTPWNDTFIEHGRFTFFYPDGQIESTGEYDRGARSGIWKRFDPNGQPKQDRFYPPQGAAVLRRTLGIDKG